jgi:inner membrane protease subunit 1
MVEVPPGHIWVEGDNSTASVDSRDYGVIPMGLIQGKVVLRLSPFSLEIA